MFNGPGQAPMGPFTPSGQQQYPNAPLGGGVSQFPSQVPPQSAVSPMQAIEQLAQRIEAAERSVGMAHDRLYPMAQQMEAEAKQVEELKGCVHAGFTKMGEVLRGLMDRMQVIEDNTKQSNLFTREEMRAINLVQAGLFCADDVNGLFPETMKPWTFPPADASTGETLTPDQTAALAPIEAVQEGVSAAG